MCNWKQGEEVIHKITFNNMIILTDLEERNRYECRYYNHITGDYKTDIFYSWELQKKDKLL